MTTRDLIATAIIVTGIVTAFSIAIVQGRGCVADDNKTQLACIEATKDPAACRLGGRR